MIKVLLLFVCALALASALNPNWLNIVPRGVLTPQMDQPNALMVKPHQIVSFNGYNDNCNTSVNTYWNNTSVYTFDTRTNTGAIVSALGRRPHRHGSCPNGGTGFVTPPSRAYSPGWVSEPGKAQTTGGAFYSFFFDVFYFIDYSPIYELDARNPNNFFWTAIGPNGDIPSSRAEASFVQDPLHPHLTYLFGGVGFGATDLVSYADVFRYNSNDNSFEQLGFTSPIDDGSDGIPKSRYHAIPFLWHYGPGEDDVEFQIHQGVHRLGSLDPGNAEELNDTDDWAFNVATLTWRRIVPSPSYPVAVRHGVQFQVRVPDGQGGFYDLLCLQSGDGLHADQGADAKTTFGCLFDVDPVPNGLWCKDPRANADIYGNDPQGAWFQVPTTGEEMSSKYVTASSIVSTSDNSLYVLGGTYVISRDNTTNWQVFHDTVRKLQLNNLTRP